MLLVNKEKFVLASDRRLVKATDVATIRSAAEIVATAEADAARIREEAKAAYEEEKRRGYEKGLADGCRIKILGTGDIAKALTVKAHAFSASAKSKIEAAGGKCETL